MMDDQQELEEGIPPPPLRRSSRSASKKATNNIVECYYRENEKENNNNTSSSKKQRTNDTKTNDANTPIFPTSLTNGKPKTLFPTSITNGTATTSQKTVLSPSDLDKSTSGSNHPIANKQRITIYQETSSIYQDPALGNLYVHPDSLPGPKGRCWRLFTYLATSAETKRLFGFRRGGEEVVLDIQESFMVPLSSPHSGYSLFDGIQMEHGASGTAGSMGFATHFIDQGRSGPSEITFAAEVGGLKDMLDHTSPKSSREEDEVELTKMPHGLTRDEETMFSTLSWKQQAIFDELEKIMVSGSRRLLIHMVGTGFFVGKFQFDKVALSRDLSYLVKEYKIFTEDLPAGNICTVNRWSTGGPKSYARTMVGLKECKEMMRYMIFLASIFRGGKLTKCFLLYYGSRVKPGVKAAAA